MSNPIMAEPQQQTKIDFVRALSAPFISPKWIQNIMWMMLASLLSSIIIGSLVSIGYQIAVARNRIHGRQDQWHDFDLDRIMDYIMDGLWPALIQLVGGTVLSFISLLAALLAFSPVFLASGSGQSATVGAIAVGVIASLFIILANFLIHTLLLTPAMFRAGMTGDFAEGFNFQFIIDALKRVGGTMLLTLFVLWLLGTITVSIGFMLLIIPGLIAAAWMQLVAADLGAQMYDVYLHRGGQPFPLPEPKTNSSLTGTQFS
jgi:hypothetical protein